MLIIVISRHTCLQCIEFRLYPASSWVLQARAIFQELRWILYIVGVVWIVWIHQMACFFERDKLMNHQIWGSLSLGHIHKFVYTYLYLYIYIIYFIYYILLYILSMTFPVWKVFNLTQLRCRCPKPLVFPRWMARGLKPDAWGTQQWPWRRNRPSGKQT